MVKRELSPTIQSQTAKPHQSYAGKANQRGTPTRKKQRQTTTQAATHKAQPGEPPQNKQKKTPEKIDQQTTPSDPRQSWCNYRGQVQLHRSKYLPPPTERHNMFNVDVFFFSSRAQQTSLQSANEKGWEDAENYKMRSFKQKNPQKQPKANKKQNQKHTTTSPHFVQGPNYMKKASVAELHEVVCNHHALRCVKASQHRSQFNNMLNVESLINKEGEGWNNIWSNKKLSENLIKRNDSKMGSSCDIYKHFCDVKHLKKKSFFNTAETKYFLISSPCKIRYYSRRQWQSEEREESDEEAKSR